MQLRHSDESGNPGFMDFYEYFILKEAIWTSFILFFAYFLTWFGNLEALLSYQTFFSKFFFTRGSPTLVEHAML